MRKLFAVMMLVLVVGSMSFAGEELNRAPVNIELNGERMISDTVEPFIVEGTTMLPVRLITTTMGMDVLWIPDSNTVVVDDQYAHMEHDISLENGKWRGYPRFNLIVNDELVNTSGNVPGIIIKGSSYVPLRLLANSLGLSIEWDAENQKVLLSDKEVDIIDSLNVTTSKGQLINIGLFIEKGNEYLENFENVTRSTGEYEGNVRFVDEVKFNTMNLSGQGMSEVFVHRNVSNIRFLNGWDLNNRIERDKVMRYLQDNSKDSDAEWQEPGELVWEEHIFEKRTAMMTTSDKIRLEGPLSVTRAEIFWMGESIPRND